MNYGYTMANVCLRSRAEVIFTRLLRAWFSVFKLKELQGSTSALMFNAFAPPFPVVPVEMLCGLHQKGENLEEVSLQKRLYSLEQLFCDSSLLLRFGVVLIRSNKTTGFGKTQVALRLACEWARAYVKSHKLLDDCAIVVFCNTLDVLRDVVFRPGMVLVLDEFTPSDREQVIYMSETIMKCLQNPKQGGNVRARNADIKLIANMPRILTGNADVKSDESIVQAWCGDRPTWSEPLQRKSLVFHIVDPLVSSGFKASVIETASADTSFVAEQTDLMRQVFRNAHPPAEPQPAAGRLSCFKRR